jgi:glycosyltransferase involved in cell wall biosynthesis
VADAQRRRLPGRTTRFEAFRPVAEGHALEGRARDFPRRKALFWRLFQGPALKDVACIHATSELEYQSIRDWGLTAPVVIIPHGIDLPQAGKTPDTPSGDLREVLYLGRLHPRKCLDALIEAWAQVDPMRRTGWRLRIVGPAEDGYDQVLKALVDARRLPDVSIEGPLYDQLKFHAYQQADLFVLPSHNENFGIAVAEALASGTPVLCTRGAPWSGLVSERCGWWVDFATVPLREALAAAMSTPVEDLRQMGQRGRDWMSREYSWAEAGRRMRVVYEWLKNGGKAPVDVVLD